MKLEQYIALHLAFIVCLSSSMLGMGQGDVVLPVITLIGAGVSLWLVDFKKLFYLGPVLSNTFIMIILIASIGYLIQAFDVSLGGSLFAVAILRVLVFFQLVLLFRKKENRTCWNIMMVSFLEVIVASVFQQTVIFGLLMILYLFAALTVVTLMHLNRDRRYFTQHVFLRSLFRADLKEMASRQGLRRLCRQTLAAMFSSPLTFFGHWQPNPKSAPQERSGTWEASLSQSLAKEKSPPNGQTTGDTSPGRWPLAREKAVFSGSTANLGGMIGIDREFYYRLVVGTVASLVVGLLIFFLTPRQDFRIRNIEMQKENWRTPASETLSPIVNSVGFNEEIRLGSLGTVFNNPSEVMSVNFSRVDDTATSNDSEDSDYADVRNQSVYFRGVALQDYRQGRWSSAEADRNPVSPPLERSALPWEWDSSPRPIEMYRDQVDFPIDGVVRPSQLPAAILPRQERSQCRFQPDTQLVRVQCEYVNTSQETLFAVWPYFLSTGRANLGVTFMRDRIVTRGGNTPRNVKLQFLTYAFRNGNQVDLIPCQEAVNLPALLAFDETALPTVGETALQWDAEQRNRGSVERAKNLENQFLTDERYYYALGGIVRSTSLDPLEDFVRDHPGGHCEYFAGALVMMLRKIGIPARVVVGYRLDTESGRQGEQRFVVRQADAHSWVEAYIPPHQIPESLRDGPYADWWGRGGWLRLDPTAPLREVIAQTGFWAAWKFKATSFWNDYIINFNAARQENAIYFPIAEFFASMKERFFDAEYWKTIARDVMQKYASVFRELRQGNWQGNDLVLLGIPLVIILALCYVVYRLVRRLIREMQNQNLARGKRHKLVTVEFYLRFEKILHKIGLTRVPTETQREFARRSAADLVTMVNLVDFVNQTRQPARSSSPVMPAADSLAGLPGRVSEAFYRVRYGDVTLTSAEADEINAMLHRLETAAMTVRK